MRDVIIDAFAGGGGASIGIEKALGRKIDIAINHDPDAILMHKTNHPNTLHITEDIFTVDLQKYLTKGQRVRLLWASPDCTSHSKAKGGKPREKGLRILPWAVYKLCKQIREITGVVPDIIFMENVEEIQDWGPLDENGHPIKERKGEDYKRFIRMMKSLGYEFDSRELVAADYGAPTTRKRWYGIFRSDGQPITWPEPTHGHPDRIEVRCGLLKPWEPISKYIDWSDLGSSIFARKISLKEKTLKRIARGIEKFIINDPNPYILPDNTAPGHFGLVSVFLIKYYGSGIGQSVNEPIGTIVTKDRFGLVSVMIKGEPYQIVDIWFRMLKPEELKLGQGFPADYIIDRDYTGKPYPKSKQVERIGNSVVPLMAEILVKTNMPKALRQESEVAI